MDPEDLERSERALREKYSGGRAAEDVKSRDEKKQLDKSRMESSFDWLKGECDVERLRTEMFSVGFVASQKQNDLLNELEDLNRLIKSKMNERGQAEEVMKKIGVHNVTQRESWELKMIAAGDVVSENRKKAMTVFISVAQSLNWELSSGHYHALARDISGAEDGSYLTKHDAEAQALYDEQAQRSDDEFYERTQMEKSDPFYALRPSSYTKLNKTLAVDNSAKLQKLLNEKIAENQTNEERKMLVEKKAHEVLIENDDKDPLDIFMAQNAKAMVKEDNELVSKDIVEIKKLIAEYQMYLTALDVKTTERPLPQSGDLHDRFSRIQKNITNKVNNRIGAKTPELKERVNVSEPYSTATDDAATSKVDQTGQFQVAADLISMIRSRTNTSDPKGG